MSPRSKTSTPEATLPPEIEKLIATADLDAVEDRWLTRLESDPADVPFFAATARGLEKNGHAETARFLLEMLDEQLEEQGLWEERLELLRHAGHLLVDAEELHPAILATLEELFGDRPSFPQLAEKVGLHRAVDDLPKSWKKVERLRGLLDFDVGSIVRMKGKGAGRVSEVNMALESFKVRFESGLELQVGFGGAAKLLQPLPEGHFLHRKVVEPEALEKLRDDEPAELLRAVLESFGRPLTGAEVKRHLAGIVPESGWNRWWTAARKHPQVVTEPGSRQAYSWAASSEHAQDAVWETFEAADPRTRIDLLRRDGERDPELKRRMAAALAADAGAAVGKDPGLAIEVWYALERAGEAPGEVPWAPVELITGREDPRQIFAGIQDRAVRERFYELARERRSDWPELFARLLWQEEDPRSLDALSEALIEEDSERFDKFFDQLLSQPRKNPAAFTWLVERAAERESWMRRNPIRLLQQILHALTDRSFASLRAARLVPLADSGGTLPRLLAHLGEEQAEQAHKAVQKAPGLEGYQREPLLNAILLRFPSLRQEAEAPLYAVPESIAAKRAEMKQLKEEEIPANRRAIEEARELGDLRENFEYKSARQRHEYLSARLAKLHHDLTRVRPIDPSQVSGTEVVIGSRVRLTDPDGGRRTITLLGPWESDPEKDVLSNESEMAQALLGRKPGESVELAGVAHEIEAVEPYR